MEILQYLKTCAKNNTLAHAYCLIGANNRGRMDLLRDFFADFIPAQNLNHPDIRIISPEKNLISIDTMRSARVWLSMTPISSNKKALIIESAWQMNKEAQNAFLKILEEPAKNTYIFLIINHKDQILPTIYSRSVPVYIVGKSEPAEQKNNDLIKNILNTENTAERMRLWLKAKIEKEEIHAWLMSILPQLRQNLLKTRSKNTAIAIRSLLKSLFAPIGQNWQMTVENLIISI